MNLFQSRLMPFYQFGDMVFLEKIATEDWVPFIRSRFATRGKTISPELASSICEAVQNHSSYVQQLSWNVLTQADEEVTEADLQAGINELLAQNSALFMQQIEGFTTYQMNFIRALCKGVRADFASKEILEEYQLGTKSNITRLRKVLLEKEIIEMDKDGICLADPVFELWFKREYLQ